MQRCFFVSGTLELAHKKECHVERLRSNLLAISNTVASDFSIGSQQGPSLALRMTSVFVKLLLIVPESVNLTFWAQKHSVLFG